MMMRMRVPIFFLLLWTVILMGGSSCFADDHRGEKGKHHDMKMSDESYDKLKKKVTSFLEHGKRDEGNETTGQMAAWAWACANLTIALSILIKWIQRFAPLKPTMHSSLNSFNSLQKKYLRWAHYYLNPLILGMAVVHWVLSRCRSTSLPEWGLFLMGGFVLLGIALKFKLCPASLKGRIYTWHTQPLLFLTLIAVLLAGHSMID